MPTMVHLTRRASAERILVEGLRPGMAGELTLDCAWTVPWYGNSAPVFVGDPGSRFVTAVLEECPDLAVLEVDVEDLPLVADLASLVDHGAQVEDGVLWWREGREPPALLPWLTDGEAEIVDLLDPAHPICLAAIEATGTAAHLGPVPADRIRPAETAPAPAP